MAVVWASAEQGVENGLRRVVRGKYEEGDGRGHHGNHGWVSGPRPMVWVMFRALEWISLASLANGVSQC